MYDRRATKKSDVGKVRERRGEREREREREGEREGERARVREREREDGVREGCVYN